MTTVSPPKRIESIDFLKGLAIIFVIATHAFSGESLKMAGATLYIGQAVPIFLLVAGLTSQLSFARRGYSLKAYYYKLPAQLVYLWGWYLLTVLVFMAFLHLPLSWGVIFSQLLYGQIGAGGYFIPLMIQHLLFFPLLMLLKYKLNNTTLFIFLVLILNAILEYLCLLFEVESTSYRVLYVRYISVAALGAVFADWMRAPKTLLVPLTAVSMAYILAVIYAELKLPFIPDLWTNHHYPAVFYSASFCALCTVVYNKITAPQKEHIQASTNILSQNHDFQNPYSCLVWTKLQPLLKKGVAAINGYGKSSYMIYLFQMIYFTIFWDFSWFAAHPWLRAILSFPICIMAGLLITRLSKLHAHYKSTL